MKATSFPSVNTAEGKAVDLPPADLLLLPFWAAASFRDDYRDKAHFIEAYALGFDCDQGQPMAAVLAIMAASGLSYVAGTTRTHQLPKKAEGVRDRLRVLVPLAEPVGLEQYKQAHEALRTRLGLLSDPGALDATHGWFACTSVVASGEGGAYRAEPLRADATRYTGDEPIRGSPKRYAEGALARAEQEILDNPNERNKTIYRNACGIGRLVVPCGLDYEMTFDTLMVFAAKVGSDDFKTRETVRRGLDWGMLSPKELAPQELVVTPGEQLVPLPDKAKHKEEYQAWMRSLRNACDAKLVLIQYDQSRLLYERIGDRQVEVLGTSLVQAGAVTSIGESAGLLVPPSVAESMAHAYLVQAHASRENPSLFDKGSGLYRWKSPEVKEGPTPNWDYFLSRLSDPEAFLAHVWSAFEPRFEGRQAMWLQGEGNDGKSIAIQAILKGAGFSITACNDDDLMRNDKFMFSTVWDKPVILVSDSKAVNLAMQGVLHRLTGRDPIGVEYKHGPRFSAEFQGVVWITSNQRPNIEANRSNLSRLTILTLEFGDWVDGLKHRLRSEVPALLYRARDVYARACPRHFEIALNAKSLRLLKEATGYESDSFRAALQNAGLLFDAAGFVSKAEILSRLKINLQSEAPRVKSLYRWLRDQPGIKECNKGADAVPSFQGLKLT